MTWKGLVVRTVIVTGVLFGSFVLVATFFPDYEPPEGWHAYANGLFMWLVLWPFCLAATFGLESRPLIPISFPLAALSYVLLWNAATSRLNRRPKSN